MNEHDIEDQGTNTPADQTPDPIKQLKGEFNRKIDKTNTLLEQLAQTQAQLQRVLEQQNQKTAPVQTQDDDLGSLLYSDPTKFAAKVVAEAEEKANRRVSATTEATNRLNATIAALANEYPELADTESKLTKLAADILKGASEADRYKPETYDYAVLKAATQLDVKPRSKRAKVDEEDGGFLAPSSGGQAPRRRQRSESAVIEQQRGFAEKIGLNLDDPTVKARYIARLKEKGVI